MALSWLTVYQTEFRLWVLGDDFKWSKSMAAGRNFS